MVGFFGRLFGRGSGLEKHAQRVANKRAQAPDRWESIQALGKIATSPPAADADEREDAIAGLMMRFTYFSDPSITDGEEKDEVFRWVCEAGDVAIAPVERALAEHESLSWPLKVLEALNGEEDVIEVMLEVLSDMDTEYERDPQRKIQLLSTFEARRHPKVAAAVAPFFTDVSEEARFHAVGAALQQEDAESILPELRAALAAEESLRVSIRALDLLAERGLGLPDAADLELPGGYRLDADGVPKKGAPAAVKKAAQTTTPTRGPSQRDRSSAAWASGA